ncbi:MAG: hypothetical protein A3K22_04125 [Deltaproteobacteria bacterium RBG_16_42_7]|nr:MAG: hypothetical protein A2052_02060 [Deltaproteobacteria bacterium GWA2_54_12]OGP65725.1 MAG: hypothetical protein A3K22_04125 [Deltaproteobacteria bacterium RBG_16_42_7]
MTASVSGLIGKLKTLRYALYLEGEKIRFKYAGEGEPPENVKALLEALREHKGEAIAYLKKAMPRPSCGPDGDIVIPFGSDSRYHWWMGGQSVKNTIEEIKGAVNA